MSKEEQPEVLPKYRLKFKEGSIIQNIDTFGHKWYKLKDIIDNNE